MEPKVYSITEIKDMLCISRTKAYEYIKKVYEDKGPFRVVKVGNNYRVVKTSFDEWLNNN